jgi:hypothetical protein
MGSFILIGLGGVAVSAALMTLVAYACFKAGLLPGVKWRWPFRRRSDVSGAAHALGGRPNIRVNGGPRSLGTRSNIYVGMVQGPPVVEIADVRHVHRVIARDNGSSTYAIAA